MALFEQLSFLAENMDCLIENILYVLIFTLFLIIYVYYKNAFRYWSDMGVPQLDPSFPFGDMYDTIFRKQNMGDKIKQIYDRMKGERYVYVFIVLIFNKKLLTFRKQAFSKT